MSETDEPEAAGEKTSRRPSAQPRRVWWWTFAAVSLVGVIWAVTTPLFSVQDEPAHSIRAASAARGQILPGERTFRVYSTYVDVPEPYAKAQTVAECYLAQDDSTSGCESRFDGSDDLTEGETSAGLYPPVYYVVVGLPSLVFSGSLGFVLMRIVTAALCAALLASAVVTVWSRRQPLILIAGMALALTPKAAYLIGAVNPNALEIAAAIGLWVSLAAALTDRQPVDRRLLVRIAVAGTLLVVSRPGSPLWVALIVVTVAVWAGRRPVLEFVRDRRGWIVAGIVAAASIFTVGWVTHYGTLDTTYGPNPTGTDSLTQNIRIGMATTTSLTNQMVGLFGHLGLDTRYTLGTVYIWFLAFGALLVFALAWTRWRQAAVLVALAAAVVLLPILLQAPRAGTQGFPWHGRYTIPLAAGLPILAAFQIEQARQLPEKLIRHVATIILVLVTAGHLYAWAFAFHRFSAGVDVLTS